MNEEIKDSSNENLQNPGNEILTSGSIFRNFATGNEITKAGPDFSFFAWPHFKKFAKEINMKRIIALIMATALILSGIGFILTLQPQQTAQQSAPIQTQAIIITSAIGQMTANESSTQYFKNTALPMTTNSITSPSSTVNRIAGHSKQTTGFQSVAHTYYYAFAMNQSTFYNLTYYYASTSSNCFQFNFNFPVNNISVPAQDFNSSAFTVTIGGYSEAISCDFNITLQNTQTVNAQISGNHSTDMGVSDHLQVTGKAGYTYQWNLNGTAIPEATGQDYNYTPSVSPSPYTANITETTSYDGENTTSPGFVIQVNTNKIDSTITGKSRAFQDIPFILNSNTTGGTSPYSYQWKLNGVNTSQSQNITLNLTQGTYTLELVTTDSLGVTGTAWHNLTIVPNADISVTSTGKIANENTMLQVHISNTTTPQGIDWLFNHNETVQTGNYTNYTFTGAGLTYFYVIAVYSGYNVSQKETINISLNVEIKSLNNVTGGQDISFTEIIQGGSSPYNYTWSYDNGYGSNQANPTEFLAVGNYTITLEVKDNNATGSANETLIIMPIPYSISISPTTITTLTQVNATLKGTWDSTPLTNVSWTLPNGEIDQGINQTFNFPTFNKTQHISVYFRENTGYQDNQSINLTMTPTIPKITLNIPKVMTPQIISITASVYDPDATITSYNWDINGTTFTGQTISYDFSNTGIYNLSIQVIDSLSVENTLKENITIVTPSNSQAIAIKTAVSQSDGTISIQTEATGSNLTKTEEVIIDHNSYFVSGHSNNNNSIIFNYSIQENTMTAGTYEISEIIFNSQGKSNYTQQNITISPTTSKQNLLGQIIDGIGGTTSFIELIAVMITGIGIIVGIKSHGDETIEINGTKIAKVKKRRK